jgi:succinate dehydrogenase / fumarate reductase cytochrome b subunit
LDVPPFAATNSHEQAIQKVTAMSAPLPRPRPKYYDINPLHLPMPGLVSIFHRITGVAMFLFLIPFVLLVLQITLVSEEGFNKWKAIFSEPIVKLIVLGFIWAYLHHLFAGIRYLLLDIHVGIALEPARTSARVVLAMGLIGTLLVAVRIW